MGNQEIERSISVRKINYHIAVTLDGYICRDDGGIDGFLMEGEHADEFIQSLERYDSVLMGSNTYKFGFQFGLKAGQPAYPNLRHYIFSNSLDFKSSEAVKLIKGDVLETIRKLKDIDGKEIWLCGGGELAGYLFDNDLLDKLTLKINPVIFGSGRRLFGNSVKTANLTLLSSKRYGNGVILSEYDIASSQ